MKRVAFEVSLKPFWDLDPEAVRRVCREMFRQWDALHRHAERIAVMIWAADGSEILDYSGNLDDSFEWAYWIGVANPHGNLPHDPQGVCLHSRPYKYRENPPVYTYRDLARVIATLKEVGREMTGKPIEVGTIFDPGGEFARSTFKYERHREVCLAHTMGHKTFVGCYATLEADQRRYASFPDGIPEGTTFGTFLGRQASAFARDLGTDYLWLSNGFGFGLEAWGSIGPLFDGRRFDPAAAPGIREKILGFWRDFHAGAQNLAIEVRGTNFTTGADLATDAVPLREIMEGGFNIRSTIPNSPWAAINGDFGLELAGLMSRVAQAVAGQDFLFRYYVHDPWWLNSPWLDRYGRQSHDIYLPMAVSRIDADGNVQATDRINILSVDDSYGQMPVTCPNEVTPHILRALDTPPDAPGILTWIYPFDTFHDFATTQPDRLTEAFFHDWFVRAAINKTLPLNTVVSDRVFPATMTTKPKLYRHTVLLSRVPDAGSDCEAALLKHVQTGGRALLFGPADAASASMLQAMGLAPASPLEGEMELNRLAAVDTCDQPMPTRLIHRSLLSGGAIRHAIADGGHPSETRVLAMYRQDGQQRPAALMRRLPSWQGGAIAWVRGSLSSSYPEGSNALTEDDPTQFATSEVILRDALAALGVCVGVESRRTGQPAPIQVISRNRGAMWFSGHQPDTTVQMQLGTCDGVPLLVGCDAELCDGVGHYRFPLAYTYECRVLVEQKEGVVRCREFPSVMVGVSRRLRLDGLENATVRILLDDDRSMKPALAVNAPYPYVTGPFADTTLEDCFVGRCLVARNITGWMLISW